MCGIVGIVGLKGHLVEDPQAIFRMMEVQKHRGPDDAGARGYQFTNGSSQDLNSDYLSDERYDGVFGFNRLSILDVSSNGHQPMADGTGRVILVFNGEIYNAPVLKEELLQKGYPFHSTTDTEVVLNLYLEYGFEKMVARLNGMFAIAIADLRNETVYLSRDRLGIKPLYYLLQNNKLFFASELKSIIVNSDVERELNLDAAYEQFCFRTALNKSLFKGIVQLEPGTILEISGKSGFFQKKKYFDLDNYHRRMQPETSKSDYEDRLMFLLGNAVKRQMASDVKLGCQLSGGVDSSIIAHLYKQLTQKKPSDNVSIVFRDERFSEESYIDYVSKKLDMVTHKFLFDTSDFLGGLEKTVWHQEAVLTHPNSLCLMQLTKEAKQYVTVLLSGEGSDELMAGYPRFSSIMKMDRGHGDYAELAVTSANTIPSEIGKRLLAEYDPQKYVKERTELFQSFQGTEFDKHIKYELATYLPELLLRQDKMSMANSIENRVPFLDHELMDFAFSIPQMYLVNRQTREGKDLLKRIVGNIFGIDFAYRKKMGFSIPVQMYMNNERFKDYFYDLILPGVKRRGIISVDYIQSLYEKIDAITYNEIEALWRGITLEIWCQLFLEGRKNTVI